MFQCFCYGKSIRYKNFYNYVIERVIAKEEIVSSYISDAKYSQSVTFKL